MSAPAPFLAPSLARLRSQVNATWPQRSRASDGWIGDEAHARTDSDHNPDSSGTVRALDITASGIDVTRLLAALRVDARVSYVIHARRLFGIGHWEQGYSGARGLPPSTFGDRAYAGSNPHLTHVHVSIHRTLTEDGEVRPWFGLEESMISPVAGRVTSEYGSRGTGFHAGIDIAAPLGSFVHAAYAGRVSNLVRDRVHDRSSAQTRNAGKAVVAAGRTGNGLRVVNPDGETQLYGHVQPLTTLSDGSRVVKGQVIGLVDLSGNTTGPHLHFETWNRNGTTRNPRVDFRHHGVTPGSTPQVVVEPIARPVQPAPAPPASPAPPAPLAPPAPSAPPGASEAVRAYQRRQNQYGQAGLVVDGIDGPRTQAWRAWVRELQTRLNRWAAVQRVGRLLVDGDFGARTRDAVTAVQSANRGLFGAADGVVGPRTIAALGMPARPRTR